RAHGPRSDRTRRREERAGNRYENDLVLRRGIPVGAGGGQPAKDGLHERGVDGWRLARMERNGVADGKGLTAGAPVIHFPIEASGAKSAQSVWATPRACPAPATSRMLRDSGGAGRRNHTGVPGEERCG